MKKPNQFPLVEWPVRGGDFLRLDMPFAVLWQFVFSSRLRVGKNQAGASYIVVKILGIQTTAQRALGSIAQAVLEEAGLLRARERFIAEIGDRRVATVDAMHLRVPRRERCSGKLQREVRARFKALRCNTAFMKAVAQAEVLLLANIFLPHTNISHCDLQGCKSPLRPGDVLLACRKARQRQ